MSFALQVPTPVPGTGDFLQEAVMYFLVYYAIPTLITALGTVLVFAANEARKWIKTKLGAVRYAEVVKVVEQVVKAVEQSGLKENLELTGEQKLQRAIQDAQTILIQRGLGGIDTTTLATVIRAALRDGIHKGYEEYHLGEPLVIDEGDLAELQVFTDTGEPIDWTKVPVPNNTPSLPLDTH